MLILVGGCFIGIGIFNKKISGKNLLGGSSGKGPSIEVVQDVSQVKITVSSDIEIDKVVYKWNDDEETQTNAGNDENTDKNKVICTTNIPIGDNILYITATDINGNEKTLENSFVGKAKYTPKISISQEEFTLKWNIESQSKIKKVSYIWDNEEEITKEFNDVNAEIEMEIRRENENGVREYLQGEHSIKITVVNEDEEEYKSEGVVYLPVIEVTADEEKYTITAEDKGGISKVTISINGTEREIELSPMNESDELFRERNNSMQNNENIIRNYSSECREEEQLLKLLPGNNDPIVKVYNVDGLSTIRMIRYPR